jgi:hypothetical protein
MANIENLRLLERDSAPDLGIKPRPTNCCNERGMMVEKNTSELLSSLDYVLWVRRTEKDGI